MTQRERAQMLIREGCAKKLTLVRVEYPDLPPRVSIIGHAILPCMIEIWREGGAAITTIEELT